MAVQYGSRDFSLAEVVQLVGTGRMALPEFQRDFVWDPNQVVELLDSVSNGWPIGSLLVLNGPQPFEVKEIYGGPGTSRDKVEFYLLDGQQRVTALFHAFTNSGDFDYFIDVEAWLTSPNGQLPEFKWKSKESKRQLASGQILLHDFLDVRRFETITKDAAPDLVAHLKRLQRERFGQFLHGGYALPAIVLASDIELEAMTRIFETLNRTGERLDAFDLMVAVLYPHKFHLRDEYERALDEFPRLKVFDVNGIEVLKLIALWQRDFDDETKTRPTSRRVTGVRQRDVLNIPATSVKRDWSRALNRYSDALEFVEKNGGVLSPALLPSSAMVLTLAYLLDAGRQESELNRWYWNAIALQSYAQGANTQVLSDIDRPKQPDRVSALSAFEQGVNDLARRNRILRLGVAGLSRLHGARDILTGKELGANPKEFSIVQVTEGQIRLPSKESVRDIAFVESSSLTHLRKLLRSNPTAVLKSLDFPSLRSQGFSVEDDGLGISSENRPSILAAWLGEQL